MKCKLCGSEIDERYNYCLYCGKDIIIALDDDDNITKSILIPSASICFFFFIFS